MNNLETANNQSIPNKLYDIISSRLSPKQDFYNINPLLSYTRYKTYASNNSTPRVPNANIIRSSRSVDYSCINDDTDIKDLHTHLNELEKMINHMKIEGGYYFNDEINSNNTNNNVVFNNTHQTNSTNHSLMSPASFGVVNNKQNDIINEESVDMKLTNIQTDINELKTNINKLNENIIQYNKNHTII